MYDVMRKLSLKELNRIDVATFKQQPKTPFVLVLDNVRSALNVGSAFRTSDAFALEQIILCGITATPPHREILKTAIGATAAVAWQHQQQTADAVKMLKAQGYIVLGVEQTDETTLLQDFQLQLDQKYALMFGNEVKGISDDVLPLLDACLEVPQFGTKHSFNISVCVGIVVWELFRQWKYGRMES